uniref:BAI1 associated protein 3 n=1 Tax=Scleropages formosus TaxID=113540 RepID=A0A8C9SZM4_SCLFO
MGRYFKQIAKSVRANGAAASATEENTDDFLGCLNIPINDIPVNGSDKWFKLEPRSRASKVQGECHLILRLFTTQVLTMIRWPVQTMVYYMSLADSFQLHIDYCLSLLKRLRKVFSCSNSTAITRCELLLSQAADFKACLMTDQVAESMCFWLEQLLPVHSQVKHSTSAIDITACFNQIREYWTQLAWPDSAETFTFVTHLTDDFCRAAVWYCGLIKRKIERNQPGQEHKNLILQVMVTAHNLHLKTNKCLCCTLVPTHLSGQMLSDLKRYIQHISLSPDSIQNDEAVAPLMKYLNDNLIILSGSLVKGNLSRVLQDLWTLLLRMIFDTIVENRGVQVEFYGRFQYTVEALLQFFHAEGEWMTLEDLCNSDFKALEEELRLNKCSSTDLIEQYFLEKISQQKTLKHSRFGRISVKFYYEPTDQRLTVEILHAADIIALDANGLSDPFVIVELCPLHLFPNAKSQRTQVKTKTLHPVFDEVFYFHVSPEQYRHRCACVSFTVMDYDWLSTNDFAGDAIVPLSDFCWPGRPSTSSAAKNLPPVILHLTRSKPSGKVGL